MTFARTWTPPPRARDLPVPAEPPRLAAKPNYAGKTAGPVPKKARAPNGKAEQAHKAKLAELGCMVCRRLFPYLPPGPVVLHHLRADGWGKGDYMTLTPLCVEHHTGATGVHGLGTKGFAKHYGFDQAELLMDALTLTRAA